MNPAMKKRVVASAILVVLGMTWSELLITDESCHRLPEGRGDFNANLFEIKSDKRKRVIQRVAGLKQAA